MAKRLGAMKQDREGTSHNDNAHPARRRTLRVLVRAETAPGLDVEFERKLRDLSRTVRDTESGCLSYAATRVMGSRTHFAVHASFTGWIALHRHAQTDHMKRALPVLTALMAAPVSLEIFMEV